MSGKFIVIDGNDGSGKATQQKLLAKYLRVHKTSFEQFDFPQYTSFHGKIIGKFLNGDFGKLDQINPYLITYVYAADRMQVREKLQNALKEGKIVLANRYISSNLAHQSGRFSKTSEKNAFIKWNQEFEYKLNGMPHEDILIYLFVPQVVSAKLMQNKNRGKRSYLKNKTTDMVESDKNYLTGAEIAYLKLAKKFKHWVLIECTKNGEMRTRQEINAEIIKKLHQKGIL